jgi:hypothetical protein
VDTYGSKALSLFLEGYTRLSIEDACAATQDGLDVENLTVWANRTGKWEKLVIPSSLEAENQTVWSKQTGKWGKVEAVPKEWNPEWNPEGSLCREVVTKVFGLSGEQYEAMRDVFDDINSPDPMGIYRLNKDPRKYAIVLRLPQRDKYAALKIGGTAGAGVLVGVLGKTAHESSKDQSEKWFDAYKKFLLHSERLHITLQDLEQLQNISRPPDLESQYPPTEKMKNNIFEWQYCQLFAKCHRRVASKSGVSKPILAEKIILKYQQGSHNHKPNDEPPDDYYSKLFARSKDNLVAKKQEELLQDAKVVDEQYKIMEKNRRWMKTKINMNNPINQE